MKRLLFTLLTYSSLCITARAQSKLSLGPTAGVGHAWISQIDNAKFKLAANAGLALVYNATEHFSIGLDAKYSFEGVKNNFAYNSEGPIDLNYFRLPLKAIYFFNNNQSQLRPKIFLGPSLGFLSSAKIGSINIKDGISSSDFGITAGAGFNYRLVKNSWFAVDLNYLHGISDIYKNSSGKNHNKNIGVNLGVNFGL